MGSSRRFRKQIDLDEVAEVAEHCATAIKEALSRSVMTRPGELDSEAKWAFDRVRELEDIATALDVLRRHAWQKPGLPYRTIAKQQALAADRKPTRFAKKLARFDRAHTESKIAFFSFIMKPHAQNLAKFVAGLDHPDPEEREAWETIADKTAFETWSLIRRMRTPPGRRGRPKGSGSYEAADEQARGEMNRLIDGGLSPLKAAHKLVEQLPGGGTPESKARRLRRRPEKKSV